MNKRDTRKNREGCHIPDAFFERLTDIVGHSLFSEIKKTFVERPTTFRVNGIKTFDRSNTSTRQQKNTLSPYHFITGSLIELGFKLKQVPWYKDAFILLNKSKRELTETDVYKKGQIYIQSLASMAPPLVLNPEPGERVLDLCAAPGSKTSQIAALMNRDGELVANDVNKIRWYKLQANMKLFGVSDDDATTHVETRQCLVSTTAGGWRFRLSLKDGAALCQEYQEPYFDKILIDAICSAEARFIEDDPKTFSYWKPQKIKAMSYEQQRLLLSAWPILKPGGMLVYSTCTFAPEENESRVSKLLERNPDACVEEIVIPGLTRLPVVKEWMGRVFDPQVSKTFRIKPTREVEGFFVAKLRKSETGN